MQPSLSFVISALIVVLCLPAQAQNLTLPDIGDPSRQYLSQRKERQLGASVLQRLRDRGLVLEDVQLNEYLLSVAQPISAYANQVGHDYTFYWIDATSVNAFATPGAYIGVHTGLLLATRDEDELAGVLAHEIAHVSQRHIARAVADAQRFSIATAAAMLASIAIAAADPKAGQAALTGAVALNAQRRIDITRANEQEADRIGYQLLSNAGFDGNGMARFFVELQRLAGSSAGQVAEFLLTHPRPSARFADTQLRIDSQQTQRRNHRRSARNYHLAKARARVLSTPDTNALLRYFKQILANNDSQDEIADRYGYLLALKRAGRYRQAEQQLAHLLKANPDHLSFRIEQAELALAQGNRKRAWQLFERTKKLYANDFVLAMHYGHALATQGDAKQAMRVLEPQIKRRPRNILLYQRYAQAAERAHARALTHSAMAEYYYLSGDIDMAIQQIELGLQKREATPYQQAQLQARLRQFKEEKVLIK